jgi:hypothetical protein
VGVLVRRNAIVIFMCVELMLNAVNLTFVAFARMHGNLDGQVIAHELGHLLLGRGAHSRGGIMEPNWRAKDLDKALQRRMIFPREQSEQIRAQVLARIGAASATCPP